MSDRTCTRLQLQSLEARENPSGWGPWEVNPVMVPLAEDVRGGGSPDLASQAATVKDFVFGVETPGATTGDGYVDDLVGWNLGSPSSAHIRHRMFAIVDRTNLVGVPRLRNLVTTLSADLNRPEGGGNLQIADLTSATIDPSSADGRKYKMLVAPLIVDGPVSNDSIMMGVDVSESERIGPFFNFQSQRLRNIEGGGDPGMQSSADSFYGTGVYKSSDAGSALAVRDTLAALS